MELNHNHMRVQIPDVPIKSISIYSNRIGVITRDNKLLLFFMDTLSSPSVLQKAGFPQKISPYNESFLPIWKKNIESTVGNAVFVQVIPNQNGLITILSSKEYGYYIWCDYIRDDYVFSITAPGTTSLDESIKMAFLLFNSIEHSIY